jgi:plastocyanin
MDNYRKRPLWHWIIIYLLVGALIYTGVYYFFLSKRGGSDQSQVTTQVSPSANEEVTVTLTKEGFSPSTVNIKAGAKVIWLNQSGTTATVNSADHPTHLKYPPLNLGSFVSGASLFLTFNTPGTYKYHNHLNASQFGTIIVE